MTTAYTSLLGLALPVTGELSGTWGDTVNNSITSLLDSAISGTTTISTDADITLSTTTGAANEAREAIILWTAAGTVTRNITAPAQSKTYIVINKSSSTQSIVLRGVGPTTGVTIIKGEAAVCAWNGSDFIKVSNISGAGVFSSITNTGLTSGRVVYSTTGGLETDSANLLYSGTDLTVYGLTVGRGAGAVASNTAVGNDALKTNTTGQNSTAVGYQALQANTTGTCTAVGQAALYSNTTGYNEAFGYRALVSNTTGNNNAAFGSQAIQANTTGSNNTAVGYTALAANTTASNNTALGYQALIANTTASNNTAVGYQAGYTNTTGFQCTYVGTQAGYTKSTGESVTAVGYQALYANTSDGSTAVGRYALLSNTTGANTAVGERAMSTNTTGNGNAALGQQALNANTTGSSSVAVGFQSLIAATTGGTNTAVGYQSGLVLTTGAGNAFFGNASGSGISTGSKNVILGGYTGSAAPISATGSNYIVLSDGDGNVRQFIDNNGNFVQQVTGTAPTLTVNSTLTFELTNNTTLKIKVRGTDGTTRSVSLTLA